MKDWTADDRRHRERLERNSSGGVRADRVGSLNKMFCDHMARELPGLGAYGVIRLMQDKGSRQHDAFEKAGGLEGFNRLHPDSDLARNAISVEGARGSTFSPSPGYRTPPGRSQQRAVESRGRDVKDDARDDRIGPVLRSGRVPDAGGAMSADAKTRAAKFSDGQVSPVEPEWLTVESMRAIAAARARLMCYVRQRTRNAFRVAQSAEKCLEMCRMLSWRCLKT